MMARLRSSKQESFADLVAAGFSLSEAYRQAGYKGDRGGASRLNREPQVIARVLELRGPDGLPMAERRRDVIDRLKRIALQAQALNSAAGLGVARATVVDIGKILGVFEPPTGPA